MPSLSSRRDRAALLISLLAIGIVVTLAPYASGLFGGLVLYILLSPLHGRLCRLLTPRGAAAVLVALAMALILAVTAGFALVLINQAQGVAGELLGGSFFSRLSTVQLGGLEVGPRLAQAAEGAIAWLGANAFGLLGTATRMGLNLTIALFIVYYLLLCHRETWDAVRPYIPFSPETAVQLRDRFHDVTVSTVIGAGVTACIQGVLIGLGFLATGLAHPAFWAMVTVIFSILPVVGSGLVWVPGALVLLIDDRPGAMAVLVLAGIAAGNVDLLVRPLVFQRFAHIHPLVTLVGAIGGIGYFGLLGILIGPLALSYFFQLLDIYRQEYVLSPAAAASTSGPAPPGA